MKEQYLLDKLCRISSTINQKINSALAQKDKDVKNKVDPRMLAALSGKIQGYIECRKQLLDFIENEQLKLERAKRL